MRNNLFKNLFTVSLFRQWGPEASLSRVAEILGQIVQEPSAPSVHCTLHALPTISHSASIPCQVISRFFFRAPYDRRKILVTELRTVPG